MTTYDELRADLDTVVGLLHALEARMEVRIKEHARMKETLKYYADPALYKRFGCAIEMGGAARDVLDSLSKGNP